MQIRTGFRGVFVRSAMVLLLCGVAGAHGATWTNTAGGIFHDANNWEDGLLPGLEDDADFGVDSTFQVTLTDHVAHSNLNITAGAVTFALEDHDYDASGRLYINDSNAVFTNGALTTDSFLILFESELKLSAMSWTNVKTASGDFDLGSESADSESTVIVDNGSTVHVGYTRIYRSSELIVTGGSFMRLSSLWFRVGSPVITVSDGAVLLSTGSAFITNRGCTLLLTVDDALFNTTEAVYFGGWGRASTMTARLVNSGIWTNDSSGQFYIGGWVSSRGTMEVESGGELIVTAATAVSLGGQDRSQGTLTVRDADSAARIVGPGNPGIRFGVGGTNITSTILVETGGLLRVENDIWQNAAASTGIVDVVGSDARIEAGSLFIGANASAVTISEGSLTVTDGGRVTVAADIHKSASGGALVIGGVSTITVDGGAVEADSMTLNVEAEDRATLAVNLHTGGTNTMISVSGESAVGDADFEFTLAEGFESEPGDTFTIIEAGTLTGEFNGIGEGEVISVGDYYQFRASYEDDRFTLRTMPPKGTILILF